MNIEKKEEEEKHADLFDRVILSKGRKMCQKWVLYLKNKISAICVCRRPYFKTCIHILKFLK